MKRNRKIGNVQEKKKLKPEKEREIKMGQRRRIERANSEK
jgi:hypothetical protein